MTIIITQKNNLIMKKMKNQRYLKWKKHSKKLSKYNKLKNNAKSLIILILNYSKSYRHSSTQNLKFYDLKEK